MRPLLLFLPGMMCDQRLFAPQIDHFSKTHDIQVAEMAGVASIEGLASRAIDRLESRTADVIGLSMGGITALEIARQRPGQVKSLALLNMNFRADASWRRPVRQLQIDAARAGRLLEMFESEIRPHYLARSRLKDRPLLELLSGMASEMGAQAFVEQSIALRDRESYEQLLPLLDCPVLAIAGDEDRICPPSFHQELVGLCPDARYIEIADCGHISTLERPEQVNHVLETFFKEIGNSP
jgi:pimeloyl-ACP methyl ester carboxylesterase